jgi:phage gp29-like protein
MGRSNRKRRGTSNFERRTSNVEGVPSAVENIAPVTADSGPLHTTAAALKFLRQNKHNPLPYLKPDMLSRVLESFEHGNLREAVLLWEKMAERDDMISNVKPKREKDVSQLDMQVVTEPDTGAEGEAHKDVLLRFWKSIRAVNAYDRNERGGFRRLVKQMMTATSFKYAAHHIIWTPRADGTLSATFEFVPLWLFENTTGRLRYLKSMSALAGEELNDSEWMVTTGDGLMIACSIGYLAKRSAFNDWLIFSEKFSVPGVLGRTSAKAGTPEANAMTEATQAFGHDWCAVITGDDGTHAEPIKIVQAQGNPSGMPMPAVIERVDRRIAALYRGADLSSMSSGSSGEGSGASLQEKETDILRRDDAETIAETLAEVSRMVIEWHFGNGVAPLARVELVVPVAEDATQVVTAATLLADRGAKVSASALMDRLNLPVATDEADALSPAPPKQEEKNLNRQDAKSAKEDLEGVANSSHENDGKNGNDDLAALRAALTADLQPLGTALAGALQAGDLPAMQAALRKISEGMPELAGDAEALTATLAKQFTQAFTSDA